MNTKEELQKEALQKIKPVKLEINPETGLLEPEVWISVVCYSDYYVSNYGRVVSFRVYASGVLIKPGWTRNGYLFVNLVNDSGNRSFRVNRLVLICFNGLKKGKVSNHKNGIKKDNRLLNLEWLTPSDNNKHAYRLGLKVPNPPIGEACSSAKLNEPIIRIIRDSPLSNVKLAEVYSVSTTSIRNIKTRNTWRHVV